MGQNQRALARRYDDKQLAAITGSHRDARRLNEILGWASNSAHLIAPATSAGVIPEGTSVAVTVVDVDAREMQDGGEVYSTGGGKYGLGKSALDRIAQAAGLSWDAHQCRRLDDGSDPHYCHYKAVGTVRLFDGVETVVTGEKEMDLRDGSPQCQALQARSKRGDASKQIREMRLHILAHAESKAKNRAIRSLGLKSGFVRDDLSKPFVVARLMWTGQTDDPVLRRQFAQMTAANFLSSSRALYGTPTPAEPSAPALTQVHAPPPVGAVGADADDVPQLPPRETPAPPPAPRSRPRQDAPEPPPPSDTPSPPPAEPPRADAPPGGEQLVVPGGREKGMPIAEAGDGTLEYWERRISGNLERGETDARFVDRERELAEAMRAELERRRNEPAGTPSDYGDEADRF